MDEQLAPFVERLIKEKGLDYLEDDVLDEIRADLYSNLEDRINTVIVEKLPKDQLGAFEKLLDSGTGDDTQAFVRKHIPDLDEVVARELVGFRDTYLGS